MVVSSIKALQILFFISKLSLVLSATPKGVVCPEEMRIGWLDTPPYLTDQENQDGGGSNASDLKGIIMDLTAKGLEVCCRNNVTSVYEKKFHDIAEMVEASVNSSLDLVLPVRLSVGKEMFIAFPFIGLVESPGAVFYNLNRQETRKAVINMLVASVPAVALLLVWVCIFGVLFWIVDILPQKANMERTWSTKMGEIWDSIWWAFVTLATVGYGDVIPRRVPGRILCYIWLLLSNIAIACFSATVTSILIAECFNSELSIEGSKIGVVNGSREHSLVLKRIGIPVAYTTVADLIQSIHTTPDLEGIVIDLYTASYHSDDLHAYRIQKIFENISLYGIVLRTRTVHLRPCLRQFVLDNQREIYAKLRGSFPPLRSDITSSASVETSKQLLSPNIKEIQKSFIAIAAVLAFLCLLGIFTEKYRINATRKKYKNSNDVLENFVLLQTLKFKHNERLKNLTENLASDVDNLKILIERTMSSAKEFSTGTIFRANPTKADESQKEPPE